jgi:hypothetical protein
LDIEHEQDPEKPGLSSPQEIKLRRVCIYCAAVVSPRLRNSISGIIMPGPVSQKNLPLGPAATDLGLGDLINEQMTAALDDAKKKKSAAMVGGGTDPTNPLMGAAATTLLKGGIYGG